MMDAPRRIKIRNGYINEPMPYATGGGETLSYILATHEALAASPEVAKLIADAEARGMERAAEICAGLADQVSDAALTGLPEQARLRESMEAAFTKARHAIRAEAAAIRRAAEETGT